MGGIDGAPGGTNGGRGGEEGFGGGTGGGDGGCIVMMVKLRAEFGKPTSAAMLLESNVVDVVMTAPSAPRAVSVLLTPTEMTDDVPLTLAAINAGSELMMSSPI